MKLGRAVVAGLAGTAVMTMLMLVAPMMGFPPMPIGEMLGSFLRIGSALGWAMHFVIGVMLSIGYVSLFATDLPGPPALRGALFGIVPFLAAQVAVMPLMGGAIFSGGDVMMIVGSLMGHLVYGAIVGVVYGPVPELRSVPARRTTPLAG